jgi:hypothetical protein
MFRAYSGTLPAGISADTQYYVKTVTGGNAITLATTRGGATVNITGTGSVGGIFKIFSDRDDLSYISHSDSSATKSSVQLLTFITAAAYYSHNEDMMLDATKVTLGHTDLVSTTKIFDIFDTAILSGMYVKQSSIGHNTFRFADYVVTNDTPIYTITTNWVHSSDGASPDSINYYFSFQRFHKDHPGANNLTDAQKETYRLTDAMNFQAAYEDDEVLLNLINELRTKFNLHDASSFGHGSIEYHQVPEANGFGAIDSFSYVYAFVYTYTYTNAQDITFKDISRPDYKTYVTDTAVGSENTVNISGIPSLGSGSASDPTHHDTSTIKVEIYRTTAGGKNYFKVGEVTNGTTTFVDNVSDDDLTAKEALYIEGGVVENELPPFAKTMHIMENTAYYGNGIKDSITYPNRVWQSVPGTPGSVPGFFYIDLDTDVTWVSSCRTRPIAATATSVYRLEGAFDSFGRGAIDREKISDTGSLCPEAAVQAEDGLFYFGVDGIYFTDGFKTTCVNQDWTDTYVGLTNTQAKRNKIQGVYDEVNKYVYWAIDANNTGENDSILILDLKWGISSASTFLTWSNGTYFRPTAICYFSNQLLRGDTRGYVFKHSPSYTSDPRIDTSAAPSTWGRVAITYDYISTATDFGLPRARKFIPSAEIFFANEGNLSAQLYSINDNMGVAYQKALKPIRYRGEYTGIIKEERMMPAGGLRCSYKQIRLTNATVIITNSDTLGAASVNRSLGLVTLDSAVTEDWPTDALDWYIYFEKKNVTDNNAANNVSDNYNTGYLVTVRTADTLTVSDPTPSLPQGSVKWILKGVPKDEVMELQEFSVNAQVMDGDMLNAYSSGGTGANA